MASLGEISVDLAVKGTQQFKSAMSAALAGATALVGGLTAATAALTKLTTDMASSATEAKRMGDSLGIGAEAFQEFAHVFGRFGLEANDVTDAFNTINDRANDAASGMQSMADDFALIGLGVEDLAGKNPEQLFNAFADAMANTTDISRRNAAAVRILGDDLGRKMIPMLDEGTAGLDAMRQEARDLGLVLSNETAAASEKFSENLDRLQGTFTGLKNEIGAAFLPILDSVVSELTTMSGELQNTDTAAQATKKSVTALADALQTMAPALTVLGTTAGVVVDSFKTLQITAELLAIGFGGMVEGVLIARAAMTDSAKAHQDLADFQANLARQTEQTKQRIHELGEATMSGMKAGEMMTGAVDRLAEAAKRGAEDVGELGKAAKDTVGEMDDLELILNGYSEGTDRASKSTKSAADRLREMETAAKAANAALSELTIAQRDAATVDAEVMEIVSQINRPTQGFTPVDENQTPGAAGPVQTTEKLKASESSLGNLASAAGLATGALGALTGGVGPAVSMVMEFASESERMSSVMGSLRNLLSGLIVPIFDNLGDILQPVVALLINLAPVIKGLMIVTMPLILVLKPLAALFQALMGPIKKLGEAVRKLVGAILEKTAQLLRTMSEEAMRRAGFTEQEINRAKQVQPGSDKAGGPQARQVWIIDEQQEFEAGAQEFTAVLGDAAGSVEEMADAAREATEQLTNVPEVFNLRLRQFQASRQSLTQGQVQEAAGRGMFDGLGTLVQGDLVFQNLDTEQALTRIRRGNFLTTGSGRVHPAQSLLAAGQFGGG